MANTLLEPEARPSHAAPPTDWPALAQRCLAPLVLLAALALAVGVYVWFCQNSYHLWWWIGHDRHTHYMYGLNLAMDVRTFDLPRLVHDFDRIRVWGPLHPVLVGAVEVIAGPNHRLAVLPSLVGWIMAMWFAFRLPRRLLPSGGDAAGLIAACLVALSPAHRAFATDVMYESLGAGLSLAALYFYLGAVQQPSARAGLALGLTLSALFLHKTNYWLLVLFGLGAGEIARQPAACWQYARWLWQRENLPRWLRGEIFHPVNWLALGFAAAAATVALTGGGTLTLAGRTISAQDPHNFVHLAYVMLFLRGVLWWRRVGREWSLQLPPAVRSVLLWHGLVVAVWFLLPKRLSYFLWYLGPTMSDQPRDSIPFMHGLPYYLKALQDDYLTLPGGLYLCAAMLVLAFFGWRWFKPGSAAVFFFFLIAGYLSCQHPMLKNRFLHSWIAAGWVLGAAGLVFAAQQLAGWCAAAWRPWAAAGVCALLLGMHCPALLEPGHAQEGGIKHDSDYPSALVIPDTYLASLADAKQPVLFCNVSTRFMLNWTFIEKHHHQRFTAEIKNYKATFEDAAQVQRWLAATNADTLVVIDIHPRSTFDWPTPEYVDLTTLKQCLAGQAVFTARERWELAEGVTITVWRK